MHVRVVAVGSRAPAWVVSGVEDYRRRMLTALKTSFSELAPARRTAGAPGTASVEDEGRRLLALLRTDDFAVALDERGEAFSTLEFARWLRQRLQEGRDVVFLIGGPDGLADAVLERSNLRWSLSRLTFPHALVRLLVAEQLYRAQTVLAGHPYHRA
jgi:23S rRNA (pseudouridine1915-N3)-methyltransferase